MIQRFLALAALLPLAAAATVSQEKDLGELKLYELSGLSDAPFESTGELLGQAVLMEHFAHW